MRQPKPETCAFDSEPGHSAAQRDGLELWHAHRHQAVGQRGLDEVLVRGHAQDFGGLRDGIHVQHAIESRDVESIDGGIGAGSEQIRSLLCQAQRLVAWKSSQLPAQIGDVAVIPRAPIGGRCAD